MTIMIPEEIWAICKKSAKTTDLAYMCAVGRTKVGDVNSATTKNQNTGASWAGRSIDEGQYFPNVPIKGIYIGDSVERWSTNNKLFRVTDPRGFVVEVPTGNIATLLHHTNVKNGVIEEECLWAREDGAHVLLPINSAPYHAAISKINQVQQALKLSDLVPGDRVKMFSGQKVVDQEWEYLGSVKLRWIRTIEYYTDPNYSSFHYRYDNSKAPTSTTVDSQDDDTWVGVFMRESMGVPDKSTNKSGDICEVLYRKTMFEVNPRIAERIPGTPSVELTSDLLNEPQSPYQPHRNRWDCPRRVELKFGSDPRIIKRNTKSITFALEILRIKGVN